MDAIYIGLFLRLEEFHIIFRYKIHTFALNNFCKNTKKFNIPVRQSLHLILFYEVIELNVSSYIYKN